ncbi:hypothetical protein [Paenibacillus pinihumi]|uniref:hypothetical protein n=1 Tax=Paenibacillus pinihumi TaxID=669462 RepID=UPI00040AE414|nr:hypothetical protein [Paenibacillus pinihumi]
MAAAKVKEENQTELKVQGADAPAIPDGQGPEDNSTDLTEPVESLPTVRAICLTNVKHNRDLYRAGQKLDLPEDVFDTLHEAKAVRRLGE